MKIRVVRLVLGAISVVVLILFSACGRVAKSTSAGGSKINSASNISIQFLSGVYQIGVGSALDLAAQVSPNATQSGLAWAVDDPTVATISAQGTIEGLNPGETFVRVALSSNPSVSTSVSVRVSATQNIQLTQSNMVLYKLDTASIGLQGNPSVTVQWRSSSPNVAAVDGTTGAILAATEGDATITAYDDRSGDPIGSCRVRVESKVRGITISQTQVISPRSSTFSVSAVAQVLDSHLTSGVEWGSSNEAVVRLLSDAGNGNYIFLAVGLGSATLTARAAADGTKSKTVQIQVLPPNSVTGFSVYPNPMVLYRGSSAGFVVSIEPAQSVIWHSSVPGVATIDATSGVILGVSSGTSVVSASAAGGQVVTISVTVREVEISEVVLTPRSSELNIGDVQMVTASVFPQQANQSVDWSVSDSTILQLVTNLSPVRVVGLKPGRAQVIARSRIDGTIRGVMEVLVKTPAVTAVNVSPATVTLYQGETVQLNSSVSPSLASQSVIWRSLDEVYAAVSYSGLVTAISPGTVQIEVKSVSDPNRFGRTAVTILPIEVLNVTASGPLALDVGTLTSYKATVSTSPSRPSAVKWRSSNEYILRINSVSGRAAAVAPGSATVYATSIANNSRESQLNIATYPPAVTGSLEFSVFSRVYWSPSIGQNTSPRSVFLTPAELYDIQNNQSSADSLDWIKSLNHGSTLQTGNYYIVVYVPEVRTDQYAMVQSLQYNTISRSIMVNVLRITDPQFPANQTPTTFTSYVRLVLEVPKSLLPINSNINAATPLSVSIQSS